MSAAARSRLPRRLLAAAALVGLILTGAGPAEASPWRGHHRSGSYVALGDSYAAGEGLPPYETRADGTVDPCHRSVSQSYPERLEESGPRRFDRLTSLACTGASTGAVVASQVPAIPRRTRTVTLTVGGNDAGFAPVLASCLYSPNPQVDATLPPGGCQAQDAAVDAAIAYLAAPAGGSGARVPLATVLGAVAARAPRAEILVSGYPQLFGQPVADCPVSTALPVLVAAADVAWIREQTAALNSAIRAGVERARAAGVRARYVDATATFAGHGLCDRQEPWINGLVLAPTTPPSPAPASFHPTSTGQWAYAKAFVLAVRWQG